MEENNVIPPPASDVSKMAGPGAHPQDHGDIRPMLEGLGETDYVEILNPLSVDFAAQVGVTRTGHMPLRIVTDPNTPTSIETESDIKRTYGIDLRNPDNQGGRRHIQNQIIIRSGQTIRLPGNDAQVVIKQLVNEIIQRQGSKLKIADPYTRQQTEQSIVVAQGSIQDLMQMPIKTQTEQLQEALTGSTDESFPTKRKEKAATNAQE